MKACPGILNKSKLMAIWGTWISTLCPVHVACEFNFPVQASRVITARLHGIFYERFVYLVLIHMISIDSSARKTRQESYILPLSSCPWIVYEKPVFPLKTFTAHPFLLNSTRVFFMELLERISFKIFMLINTLILVSSSKK